MLSVVKLQYYAKSLQKKKDKNEREQERGVGRVKELNESEYDFERM